MRTTKKKGLAWLAGVSCVCILASVFVASADPGGPSVRSVGVAVLDADAKPASVADVWAVSYGPDDATKVRAELFGDGMWYFQVAKTDVKADLYFERADGGVAMAEVALPESAEILITAQLHGKGVRCTIGAPAIGPAITAATAPAKYATASPAFMSGAAMHDGSKDFEPRQGGDTCTLAVDISGPLPISISGTTAGYANDYDEVCPYTGSTAPDVVYLYTPTTSMTVELTLCDGMTSYDTKMYVYEGTCPDSGNPVACNDDACTSAAGQGYVSELAVAMTGGVDYYIVIDGYGSNSGTYYLDMSEFDTQGDCPDNSLYSQSYHYDTDSWSAGTSEVLDDGTNYLRYESFSGVGGAICDLHWWGVQGYFDGVSWGACTESDPTFAIAFYQDAGGMPGAQVGATQIITATVTPTGDSYNDLFPGYYYSVNLAPCALLTDGWVSIQGQGDTDCWFLWMSSWFGDGHSCLTEDGGPFDCTYAYDNSMCLTGALDPGACCDILTGDCDDGVEAENCLGGRFEPNVLCADLDPPCGSPGACCYDDIPDCDDGVFAALCTDGRHEPGVLCADLDPPCGGIVGACCDPYTGECMEMAEEDCDAMGGLYLGDMVPCTPGICPCVVPCPPGSGTEGEPCGSDTNGGCNMTFPAFEPIDCGQTVCGTGWADGGTRDTDWYEVVTTEPMVLTIAVESEFSDDVVFGLIEMTNPGSGNCADSTGYINPYTTSPECVPASVVTECLAPGTHWIFSGHLDYYDIPCSSTQIDYTITVDCEPCTIPTGACCYSDGSCAETYEDSCTGYYWGDNTLCADVSCTGACCDPEGGCTDTAEDDCADMWYGFATDCATTVCPVLPDNDECDEAEDVGPLPATVLMDNTLATDDIVTPCVVYSGPFKNLWYTVTGTGNIMTASTCNAGTNLDTKISVFCGECAGGELSTCCYPSYGLGCDDPVCEASVCAVDSYCCTGSWDSICAGLAADDPNCPCGGEEDGQICVGGNDDSCADYYWGSSTVDWCSQVGATYYITVGTYSATTVPGPIQLDVSDSGTACEADIMCLPIGGCCLNDGTCVIATEIECGMQDGWYQGDDTDCLGVPVGQPCTDPDATITVTIQCDYYGSETSWELIEQGVGVIASGGPYTSNELVVVDVAVCAANCYDFIVYDSWGDGIYSPGGYEIAYEGEVVASTIGSGWSGDSETVPNIGAGCNGGGPCTNPDATLTVYIECDYFGSETTWELIEQGVGVVASGGPYTNYEIVNVDVPVCSTSCYDFVIYDSYGDGLYDPGGYVIYYEGELVVSTLGIGFEGDSETVADIGAGCGGGDENYLGACCIGVPGDNSCVVTTEACCEYVDGLFHGYGTDCGEVQVEFVSADFNTGLPADWTVVDDVGNFIWVTNDVSGRTNYAGGDGLCMVSDADEYSGSGLDYDTSLITPAFSVLSGCTLEFDSAYNYLSSEQAEVNITINGGTSWINLLTWMEDHDAYGPGEHVVLDLSAYVGETAQIAFRHVGNGWDWYYEVDNVLISAWVIEDDPCLWPTLDIKPGSCPNSFNRGSNGVMPVALAADSEFDAYAVNISTLSIARADGIGGSIGPHEGPPGPHTVVDDAATPFVGEMCDCHELGGDGIPDVKMKFKTADLVEALQMNDFAGGALVELVLTGNMLDGRPFRASDCVRLVPPGTPPGMLTFQSNNGGAWVDISPLDDQLDGGGFAGFFRSYPQGTLVTITASPSHKGKTFKRWVVDGIPQPVGIPTITRTVTGVNHTLVAKYRSSGLQSFPDSQNTPLLP